MASDDVVSNEHVIMPVTNSKGEEVIIRHRYTNFTRKIVIFYVESQNAKFLFWQVSERTRGVYPINRKPIDPDKPANLGASGSVYAGMETWIKHILAVGRVELPSKKAATSV